MANRDLKRLFDRLVYVLMDESPLGIPVPLHKEKRAVIAAACTTLFPFNIICEPDEQSVRRAAGNPFKLGLCGKASH